MKALLPMAYIFFILENGIFANGKPVPIKDNYTYRLMELEATDDDADLIRFKYPPSADLAAKLIVPRAPGRRPLSHDDDADADDDDDEGSKRKKPARVPTEMEEEISHLKIPISQLPQRQPRKRRKAKKGGAKSGKSKKRAAKSKGRPKEDDYDIVVDDMDDDTGQEEEEETEEKKEKIHKLTIKKKRPLKNATTDGGPQPYRTIVESAPSATPHRFQRPFNRATRPRPTAWPATLAEIGDSPLDPAHQLADEGRPKAVKARDVSLILRTKHRHPRILIRRYKPYPSPLAYPLAGHRPPPPPAPRPHRHKKRRRHRKRRKKTRRRPAEYGGFYHPASSCSNDHPLAQPVESTMGGADYRDPYAHLYPASAAAPLHSAAGDFSYESPALKFSGLDMGEPTNDYFSGSYDRYVFPSEAPPFSAAAGLAALPLDEPEAGQPPVAYEEKAEGLTADEPMTIGYDVHEHENTAQLAANHKQETDDSIEEDGEPPLQYDDAEADEPEKDAADLEYENEAEESLRFVSMFGKTTRASKPIKKADSVGDRPLRTRKKRKPS